MSQKKLFKSEIDILGTRMNMENSSIRKRIGVKLSNSYRIYKSLGNKIKNPIAYGLILLEIGKFFLNEIYMYDNPFVKHFRLNSYSDYFYNCLVYGTVGRVLFALKKNVAIGIIPLGMTLNYLEYRYMNEVNKKVGDFLNLKNFDFIYQKDFMPKLYISFSMTYFLSYLLEKKPYDILRFIRINNIQKITMFFSFLVLTRLSKYISYLTSETFK